VLGKEQAKLSELLRRGAQERIIRLGAETKPELLEIVVPSDNWLCWLLSLCYVPGTLLKRQNVDGVWVNFPVCNATVEVYEVDPLPVIIGNLAADVLDRIKDLILTGPIPKEPPIPLPDPSPFPGPRPGPGPDPLPPIAKRRLGSPNQSDANSQIPDELRTRLILARGDELRRVLLEFPLIVRPIICVYFPWLVKMDKVAEATTDDCGKFQAFFFKGCNNSDTPDLYFKAKRRLFGNIFVTIYAPTPITCFTHWNYQCGTDVTLYTTHPFAATCSPCDPVDAEGHWVLVTAIGNLPLSRIRGASEVLDASTNTANLGLNHSLSDDTNFQGRPFGGLLRLRMDFDNSLREDLNVKYYRVSYRRQGDSDDDLVPLELETHRHYAYENDDDEPVVEGYSLGPNVVNNVGGLFEIPPALPPKGQWTVADAVEDTTNAKFATFDHVPAADHGKFELVVELFDAGGNRVDINNVGGEQIRYYVPENQDLSTPGTIHTVSAHGPQLDLVQNVDGQDAFVLTLHVDNNPCLADVQPAQIGGSGANDCGVLTYDSRTDIVDIPFTALHPNGFAEYTFTVKRGVTLLPALTDSGQAQPPGNFTSSDAVDDLLLTECTLGGFSSQVYVRAWATNGWSRIVSFDDSDHAGFALAEEESS
jgi:hypothetical protein